MYGKIFEQIYDSSIAEDWTVRTVFQDFIILADQDGVVDRTPEAISRRTNVPLDIVKRAIEILERPDPKSRCPDHGGARLVRLDEHRDWGWIIVNYERFRVMHTSEHRREQTRVRVRKFRELKALSKETSEVTQGNAESVTRGYIHASASASASASECTSGEEGTGETPPKPKDPVAAKLAFAEVAYWNQQERLPKVKALSSDRERKLHARRADPFFVSHYQEAVDRVVKSDFCLGNNQRGWMATFDWLLQPGTVAKIMEGKYDNRPMKVNGNGIMGAPAEASWPGEIVHVRTTVMQ